MTFSKWQLIIILLLLSFSIEAKEAGCSDNNKNKIARALNATVLVSVMSVEVASCNSLLIDADSVTFKLFENNQKIHNGIRAEVAVDYPFNEGDYVNYTLDIKLPKDFKGDSPQNRWWLITQWHDQPDKRIGQTWSDFPKLSPPVAVYVEERDGVAGIGLIMFGKNKKSWFPFPLGEWLTLSIQFNWSMQDDGLIVFNVKNHPELAVQVHGKNMNNAYQHYLKFGQYRHPEIKVNSEVYVRNLHISK